MERQYGGVICEMPDVGCEGCHPPRIELHVSVDASKEGRSKDGYGSGLLHV